MKSKQTAKKEAPVTLRAKFRTRDGAIGPGKIALLNLIEETGGISAAARELGMSYRRAWHLLDTLNVALGQPVVETIVGGAGGGGARLTAVGKELVSRYDEMMLRLAAESKDFTDWLATMRNNSTKA
ncbi:MAG: LysR family transcriptional regulator [Rhodospirillales bacterium]|nr:LysR family transcriptional regulator [Rhodospirillales bacterium]MCW8951888.1 LysR family transcriptional regulator [Rhodospirillales bacterium]MCW9001144.1 LysR family transcriptional regulator [Rhodospirillales bacterium]